MTLLKKTLIVLITFILLVTLIVWTLSKTIKPEWIKTYINTQLTSLTGEATHINGEINWQILPQPGIKMTDIAIGEDNKTSRFNIAIDNLLLNLQFAPILKGNLVFNEIKIDGMHAVINPDVKPLTKGKKPPVSTEQTNSSPKKKRSIQFAIDDFLLTNGQIKSTSQLSQLQLNDLHIRIVDFNLDDRSFPIQTKFNASMATKGQTIKGNINYKGRTQLNKSYLLQPETLLSHIATTGQLVVNELSDDRFIINKITATMKTKNETIFLNPLTLTLYDGQSIGKMRYDYKSQSFSFDQTATGLNTEKLISDCLDKKLLSGKLDLTTHLTGSLSGNNWQQSLQGKGNITIQNGSILFADINKLTDALIEQLEAIFQQNTIKIEADSLLTDLDFEKYYQGTTPFKLLSIQYALDKAMITNSLIVQTNKLHLSGGGRINLMTLAVKNNLLVKVISSNKMINKLQILFKDGLPFVLSGALNKPLIYPDVQAISPVISKHLLKKTLDKPIKQLKHEIRHFLGHD